MIKLPRTLHIEGSRLKAGQVDPEAVEFAKLAGQFLVVEEKLDGTGVSLFFEENELQMYHRGTKIGRGGEFTFLYDWAIQHLEDLYVLLEDRYVLFGEWMLHKHSIFYDRLPHYFLESDIYDTKLSIWLSTDTRRALLADHHYIRSVPVLASFAPTKLSQLTDLITKPVYQTEHWRSHLWDRCEKLVMDLAPVLKETDQSDLSEGLYIKHESERQLLGRYKYVRYEFLETIINSGSHVKDREPIWNGANGGLKCLY